jgi:putative two-component system response regulator
MSCRAAHSGSHAPKSIHSNVLGNTFSFFHTSNTTSEYFDMKSVLLIDDDEVIKLGIGGQLKSMGYTVHTAADAVEAISVARKNKPDVVVIDIFVPAGDGFIIASRLQNLYESAVPPIIFVSARKDPELRERATKAGAAAFIQKPFDAVTLSDAIQAVLFPAED